MNKTQLINRTDLLTITEAAKALPGRPHRSTIWRWIRDGIVTRSGRVRLESIRLGRRVFIAPEAIDQFAEALTGAGRHGGT